MNFPQAIESGFKNLTIGKGRASRSEYWYFYLFILLVALPFNIPIILGNNSSLLTLLAFTLNVILLALRTTVRVRRLHDTNRSAYYLLWALLPIAGTVVLIVLLLTRGTVGENNYGEPTQ